MIRFLHTPSQPIGLDLGADCIKMIQLERNGGGLRVAAAAQYYFPPDLAPDSPERRALAVKAVRQMHRRNGFRGRRVISAISDGDLVIKTIRIPEGTPQEMQEAIAREAAKRLPFDVAAARVEPLDVGRVQQGNETCHEIILLAVPQEGIQAEIDLLTDMGLEPVAFDIGPCALFRGRERLLLRREDRDEVTLLVDIGATSTKVVIGHGPDIAFIKTIAIGGRDINQAVAGSLDLSLREAVSLREALARGPQHDDADESAGRQDLSPEVMAACEPVLAQLAKEISLCLRYHAVTFRGYRPAIAQLSGGEARHPSTLEYLGRALAMEVVKADPLKHMDTSRVDIGQNRRQPAPCWMLSTGLALRGLIPTAAPDRRDA